MGELAKQTGLTVRTLHHYDRIRLLCPSQRTSAGHRIYSESDIAKLQQIVSLKQLGFALEDIRRMVESPDFEPKKVVQLQLERLNESIRMQERLRDQLTNVHELLGSDQVVSAEKFIQLIEVIQMKEKYFTPEQLDEMKKQFEQVSPEERKQHEEEWAELVAALRKEFEKGTPPESLNVTHLAKRWNDFMDMVTGGDTEIVKSAEHYYKDNPELAHQQGIDKAFYEYIKKAMAHVQ
ncbi:MAG TPA: MerR family transcriptional regulator [Bacillales bacterium]|nr:MerR family transcriptional regulator [Bacillales bacterium]